MTWPFTCQKCGTNHGTAEQRDRCKREQRMLTIIALSILASIVVIALVLKVCWAAYFYSDWTCAFIECRKVIK